MTNQELFEQAVAGNWIAETFTRPKVDGGVGKFYLTGTSKGYTTFGDTVSDGDVVFYAAFDDDCNREAGFGKYNSADQSITPIESNATLANGQYIDGDVQPIAFPNGGTITGTFNAVAFNAIWKHIWDKENPHEVVADQVEQDNDNNLGDNVQDALDNLSGIIAEWDEAIKSTCQNYVSELPPANPQMGDMWTDVGVSGEQYVWEGKFWVSVTGGGLGIDLDDPDSLPSDLVRDDVGGDLSLYDKPLNRVISSYDGKGKWVEAVAGEGGGGEQNLELDMDDAGEGRVHYNFWLKGIGRDNPEIPNPQFRYEMGEEFTKLDFDEGYFNYRLHVLGDDGEEVLEVDRWEDNITASKPIQAPDFLDADGNSIIGTGGGGGGADSPWVMQDSYVHLAGENFSGDWPIYFDIGGGDGSWNMLNVIQLDGKWYYGEFSNITDMEGETLELGPNVRSRVVAKGEKRQPKSATRDLDWAEVPLVVHGKIQANDIVDADGNSIIGGGGGAGSDIPFDDGVISVHGIEVAADYETGEWGHEVFAKEGGLKLTGGHADGQESSYGRLTTYNFDPYTLSQGYVQYCYDTDWNGVVPPSGVYDNSTWAIWEHHNPPSTDLNVRIWGGRNAGKRAGIGAPLGRCDFYEGHFEEVRSDSYLDKDGNAMMSISDVIDGFSAVQQAVSDEVTVEGLRDAIANAMGGFIERLEARQAEVQAKVKKSADDYHELMEAHYQKTQEEKANV